jgi:N-methylhydantoinase A
MGLLLTDLRADFAATRLTTLAPAALPAVEAAFDGLLVRAEEWFALEEVPQGARRVTRTVDMRYVGQNYELPVALPDGPVTPATLEALAAGFARAHERQYGFVAAGEPVQLVTFRVEAAGVVTKASFQPQPDAGPEAGHAVTGARDVWLPEAGGWVSCPIYDRAQLKPGNRIAGPAVVEQMDSTTVILPGMTAHVEPYLNLVLEVR